MDIDRRTVVGAAWALPVISLAAATPATAASSPYSYVLEWRDAAVDMDVKTGVRIRNTGTVPIPGGVSLVVETAYPFYLSGVTYNSWTRVGGTGLYRGSWTWSSTLQIPGWYGSTTNWLEIGFSRSSPGSESGSALATAVVASEPPVTAGIILNP